MSLPPEPSRADVRPLHEVITALIQETSLARIRHRALLDVLTGGYTPERYFARFEALLDRDFQPLVYRTLVTSEAFTARFSDWIRETDQYYSALWRGENAVQNGDATHPDRAAAAAAKPARARRAAPRRGD